METIKVQTVGVRKRSVLVSGHATSVSLEVEFWSALRKISISQNKSLNMLITEVDKSRSGNLSSALRVFVLDYFLRESQLMGFTSPHSTGPDSSV